MADTLDLTANGIDAAINRAAERGHPIAIAYVNRDGNPAISFRGSTQVHGPQQLAIWARKQTEGIAAAIAHNPQVRLVYNENGGPGAGYLSIAGRAHVDPSANDTVYAAMVEGERRLDPERKGVAVIIDVDSVVGFGAGGRFQMARDGG